jgi:hypothetical protein
MRGGYGYIRHVPAVVREISTSGKRVLIEAQLERGGTRLTYVKPENLSPREPDPWKVGFVAAANIMDQEDGRGPEAVRKFAAEYREEFLDELVREGQARGEYHICGPESSCDMDCAERADRSR